MLTCVLNRVLIRLEDLKREHDLGGGVKLQIAYGDMEKRFQASMTEGTVISVGPSAYADYKDLDGNPYKPLKAGDKVVVAKYAPRPIIDPDSPSDNLALVNDEDVLAIITSKGETNE